jgi:hypothetical protein
VLRSHPGEVLTVCTNFSSMARNPVALAPTSGLSEPDERFIAVTFPSLMRTRSIDDSDATFQTVSEAGGEQNLRTT